MIGGSYFEKANCSNTRLETRLRMQYMEQKQEKNNEIVINTVEIGNTISQKDSKTLSDDEKQEVKDYISETYDIDKKNINIS